MKYSLYIIICALFATSCSSLVDGINDNPNSPTTASSEYILTGAEVGNIVLQTGEAARKAGIFCGYYTGIDRQHLGFSDYAVTTSDFNSQWNDAYVGTIANIVAAESEAAEEGVEGVTLGIAKTLRALAFGTTTSLWGDIPFDEAGMPEIENPAFEGQIAVYEKIQQLLDAAIVNLSAGTGRPASNSDIHFDGDQLAWKEVAYTLKARYYMHTKEYAKAFESAQNGIGSASNTLLAPHGSAADNANLNYQFFAVNVRQSDLIVSSFMASLMTPYPEDNPNFDNYRGNAKTNETARYNYLFDITEFGTQPNISDGFASNDESNPMVSFQENLLILAEAGFRTEGFVTGLDNLNAFRAFMATGGYLSNPASVDLQYDAYTRSDFEIGGIENQDNLTTEDALLREILEERYITFFGHIEGFNDTRRTEQEQIVRVPIVPNTGSQLPERFLYPTTEIDRNTTVPNPVPNFFDPTPVNQ